MRKGENGVVLIGHGLQHVLQELQNGASFSLFNELGHSELAGSVDSHEEVELPLGSLRLCNINMKEPNRVALELLTPWLVTLSSFGSQTIAGQWMRDRRLQGIETIIQRQQRVTPESDDHCLLRFGKNGLTRFLGHGLQVFDRRPLAPLRDGFGVDAQFLAQLCRAKLAPLIAGIRDCRAMDRCIAALTACVVVVLP